MEDEQRRRQIEEEMARFEQEILQVQRTLPSPPPPPPPPPLSSASPAATAVITAANQAAPTNLFIPPQLQRNLASLRPPPLPPMMMPPKPPSMMTPKPSLMMPPDPSMLLGPTDPSMMGMPPTPDQLMMSMPPMAISPRPLPLMMPSRLRHPHQTPLCPPMRAQLSLQSQLQTKPASQVASKPAVTVYSAPPKKAADLEADEILAALQKAEAELKEAKSNSSLTNETANSSSISHSVSTSVQGAGGQLGSSGGPAATAASTAAVSGTGNSALGAGNGIEDTPTKKKGKKVIRMAGQQVWEDSSLVEWDPDDFRIFCGDLGNDVTDDMLTRVFSKYPTFVRAKVIRDKRTNKSKGYGFVSFKEPQGFIKAMRELNGKYVGSRPIKLRKSTWNERNIDVVKKKLKDKQKLGLL